MAGPRAILRVNPRSRTVVQKIPRPNVGSDDVVTGIANAADVIWATHDKAAWMIDPRMGRVVGVIPLGHAPIDVDVDGRSVWTANADGTVSRVDAKTGTRVLTIPLGDDPRAAYPVQIAAGHGAIWIGVQ